MLGDENVASVAELLLARDAVAIAVHLCAGAVLQDLGGIRARAHLRTMGAPIAAVVWRWGRCWCVVLRRRNVRFRASSVQGVDGDGAVFEKLAVAEDQSSDQ